MNQLWKIYYNNALKNIKLNKIDTAIKDLRMSLAHNNNYFIYNLLGLCYFRKGLILECSDYFKKSLEISDNEEAKIYLKIIVQNFNKVRTTWNSINNLIDTKNYKKALNFITDVEFKSYFNKTENYNLITGLLYYKCNKKKLARLHWKKAHKINTDNTDTLKYLYETQGFKDIFIRYFNKDRSLI